MYFVLGSVPASADQKLDDSLVYYITVGRLDDIKALLEQGADPNTKDKIGVSVLSLACERMDVEGFAVIKALVEKGAKINGMTDVRNNPLVVSIKNNNPKAVRYFLEKGADFHVKDVDGSDTREMAMLYAGDEVQWLINEAFKIEEQRRKAGVTQKALDEQLKKYAFYSCTHQYMVYFKNSKQEKIWNDTLYNKSLNDQLQLITHFGNKLFGDFYMSSADVETVANSARAEIRTELNALVSNEGRRVAGVGTVDDMTRRCDKIAAKWNSQRFTSSEGGENIPESQPEDGFQINLERDE